MNMYLQNARINKQNPAGKFKENYLKNRTENIWNNIVSNNDLKDVF